MTAPLKYSLRALAVLLVYGMASLVLSSFVLLAANAQTIVATGKLPDAAEMLKSPYALSSAMLAGNLLTVAILWLTKLIRRRPVARTAPALPARWGWGLAGFVAVAIGLSFAATPFDLNDAGTTAAFEAMAGTTAGVVCLCLVGPVTEELVFREGVQRLLGLAGLRPYAAIGIAALLFALGHGNAAQALPALVCGCLLGLLYHKCGDIRLSATAHVLNNALGVALFYLPAVETATRAWPAAACIGTGAALCALGGGIFAYWWHLSPTPTQNL